MSKTRAIKTPITDGGELNLRDGSSLSSLMQIGALYHMALHDRGTASATLQTDAEGLKLLGSEAKDAAFQLHASLTCLGDLLANAETREIGSLNLNNLGWLLVSLGEWGMDMENVRTLVEENLQRVVT